MREEAMKMRELWVAKCQGLAMSRQQMQQQQQQQQMVQAPPQQQQQNQMQMGNGGANGRPGLMLNQSNITQSASSTTHAGIGFGMMPWMNVENGVSYGSSNGNGGYGNEAAGISSPALARALSTLSADRNRRPRSEKKPIPDEQKDDKYFERRRRNNEAAKKSRDARKAREDELAIRASFLEKDNSILKVQVHSMREEAMKMRELWVAKCQGLAMSRQQMQQQQQQQQMVQAPPQQQQQNQMQMGNGGANGRPGLMLNQNDAFS
ncbi:hypothetical protein EGW08_018337 [Elysia chlorotica]|uniref:BZIP domain-containing protein n=1 Tax=Elysia chlorotica TaxID=188477 RepID=A0A3S0ZBH5_ELYCH|nr:hypothetical protein EGW08_018337 [Elysia chlorotica]